MSNRMDNPNRSPSPDDRSSRSTTADSDSSSPPQVFQDAHRKSIYDPVPVFPAAQKVETFEKPYISASGGGSGTVSGSGSGSGLGNGSGNGSKSGNSKKPAPKRRKVSQACVYCRRSHMTCDEGRPCQRCIKRKIAHLCHDESKGPSGPAAAVASGATLTPAVVAAVANALPSLSGTMMNPTTAAAAAAAVAANNTVASLSNPRGPDGGAGYTFPALSSFPPLFASEHMGNEFNILTDFLASLDETHAGRSIRGFGGHAALTLREVVSGDSHEKPSMGGTAHGLGMTDPTAQLSSTEKFVLTAADPGDGTYDDRLNQVITAKFEAGLLKPYNYVNSYTRLQRWMETHMSPGSRARILNVMGIFVRSFDG
ncbi:hypothetical protein BC829DRAFT_472160 [Chytridium lagenaria]|nr:hypothetical protein BC829DRAFT_472160 [Chytridium lagenaria]